jgi:ADP-heptose:LPS heptosyltransferase
MKQTPVKNSTLKIGILRALHLGDMLCIIPTVRAIRHAYPSASITLIGLPWQKSFVERFQHYFNAFVEFPGWPGLPERSYDREKVVSFIRDMQHQSFDIFLQMQGNGESTNALCMLFGAKQIFGLRKSKDWCPDESAFPVSEDDEHEVLRFLKIVKALRIPLQGSQLEFPFCSNELQRIRTILMERGLREKTYVCIHPGARDPRRRWPVRNFALVADALASFGFSIVLTGAMEEGCILDEVASLMSHPVLHVVQQFGHMPLGELAALIHFGAGLVSNDTGVSHIASALQIPSVILFSEFSYPSRWAPLNSQIHKAIPFAEAEDYGMVVQTMLRSLKNQASLKQQ